MRRQHMNPYIEDLLLAPSALSISSLTELLTHAMTARSDYADLFLQHSVSESWLLEDNIVKRAGYDVCQGGAIHVVHGEQSGFAYTENLNMQQLLETAKQARSIFEGGNRTAIKLPSYATMPVLYPQHDTSLLLEDAEKIKVLELINETARAIDSRIHQVQASLSLDFEAVLILNSESNCAFDIRPLIRLDVSVVILDGSRRETGSAGAGGRTSLLDFLNSDRPIQLAKEAVRLAKLGLEAKPSPAGTMPVVLGSGWPGVLLHEAVGHGLEGDFNRRGSSAFTGRIGQQVASSLCSVIDDATLPNRRGSLAVDDEGVIGQKTVLIENGVLKNYMTDRMNARLLGVSTTGNGRRQSYAHPPLPRMTNTYMEAGQDVPEDIIKSVDKGIYCVNFSGGQVDITSGKFVFSANEAYLIQAGQISYPLKNITLIGDGPEVLKKVSMVGYDVQLDQGVGVCGKAGQSVPVGVGQPTLKVDEMVVGGTEVV